MIHQTLEGNWEFRCMGEQEWLPASVPGGVHTDLLALGKIPDPFVGDNEKTVQWIAESDWIYRKSFVLDPDLDLEDRIELVCDGVDTLAEIFLNGLLLGKVDNMFRTWKWDVARLLKKGQNVVEVHFFSPIKFVSSQQAQKRLQGGGDLPGGPHLRKAPYQWGWDWGPKLPPVGIWRSIRLEAFHTAMFEDVRVRQIHEDSRVNLQAEARLHQWHDANLVVKMKVTSPSGAVIQSEGTPANGNECIERICRLETIIDAPDLWWPNGYGTQHLYKAEFHLFSGEKLLDKRVQEIGLRTVELRQQPDEWGESFTFIVNGIPVFAKGADWIPSDSFPTRIIKDKLDHLVGSAAIAHMNMLRIWGGGYYECDEFYALCDRYGIMVWQDFMFACGIYPEDDAFSENVKAEAIQNVRRLRHHACLAIWCGNNEMEQGWVDWGWNKPDDPQNQRLKAGYDRIFHHLLPQIIASEDPDRPYWPSSASSGIPFSDPNGQQRGDTHYWDVWHKRQPFTAYRKQYPRFMSEFGFQSLPPMRTIETYACPEEQNMTSYIMEHHQRSGNGNTLMMSQMADQFRMPKDFKSLVYLSMVLQAEGIRFGVEHWRRNMRRVSGVLYWQLNDCWPVASWSSIDYFGRWKALHYAAKRFYAPLMLSIHDEALTRTIHLTSDLTSAWDGLVRWRLESLHGQVLSLGEERVSAAALSDTIVCELDFKDHITESNRRDTVLVCELRKDEQLIAYCLSAFVPDKHLKLLRPDWQPEINLSDHTLTIDLSSNTLARFVELSLEGADVVFSDNFFDLPAALQVQISVPLPSGWTLEQARQRLQIRSLITSYE